MANRQKCRRGYLAIGLNHAARHHHAPHSGSPLEDSPVRSGRILSTKVFHLDSHASWALLAMASAVRECGARLSNPRASLRRASMGIPCSRAGASSTGADKIDPGAPFGPRGGRTVRGNAIRAVAGGSRLREGAHARGNRVLGAPLAKPFGRGSTTPHHEGQHRLARHRRSWQSQPVGQSPGRLGSALRVDRGNAHGGG